LDAILPKHAYALRWGVATVSVLIVLAAGALLIKVDSPVPTSSSLSLDTQSSVSVVEPLLNTNTIVNGTSDLSLRMAINDTTLTTDQNFTVTISNYNSGATPENVSVAAHWPIANLTLYACGTLNFPFGVAIMKGNYGPGNLSSGTTLQIVESGPQSCPSGPNFSNYYFEPHSDKATLSGGCLSSSVCEQPFHMSQTITISGYWGGGAPVPMEPTPPSVLLPLQPGEYTIVAGDEWGNEAILHFLVKA
jgi:hypothetical protein